MLFVDSSGCRIAYQVSGPSDGSGLILLHALGLDMSMWSPQLASFQETHRLVRVDLRGHGRSEAPPGPYTVDDLGSDVLAVCDELGLEAFHLCGISLGGLVALSLASREPERIHTAVFANTAARIGTPELWADRIAAVRRGGMDAIREIALGRFFSEAFAAGQPEVVEDAGKTLVGTSPEGYVGCCQALGDTDLRPEVPSIDVPSLVISGGLDASTPPGEGRWLAEQIRHSRLVELEAGHISSLERPQEFARHVMGWSSPD